MITTKDVQNINVQELTRNDNPSLSSGADVIVSPLADAHLPRQELYIVNTSTGGEVLYLCFGQAAASGVGITLYPTGTYGGSNGSGFLLSQKDVHVFPSANTATMSLFERRYPNVI